MRQIQSYMLVSMRDAFKFVNLVNENIEKGWQPIGGPMFVINMSSPDGDTGPAMMQAMVKYQESLTGLGGAV